MNWTTKQLPTIPRGVFASIWTISEEPEDVIPPNRKAVMHALTMVDGIVITTAAKRTHPFLGWYFLYTSPVTKPSMIPTGA